MSDRSDYWQTVLGGHPSALSVAQSGEDRSKVPESALAHPSLPTNWISSPLRDPLSVDEMFPSLPAAPSSSNNTITMNQSQPGPSGSPPQRPSPTDQQEICTTCGAAFKKMSNLVKHMKSVHLGERSISCPEPGCIQVFSQRSNLNNHIRAVHRKERPFKCEEPGCGKCFSQKGTLKHHVKTVHRGERPFRCDKCDNGFGQRGDLNRHIKFVHDKLKYPCPLCPDHKLFSQKSSLERHIRKLHNVGRAQQD